MSDRVRIDLNGGGGVRALLQSDEMASLCDSEAKRMTQASGIQYVSDVIVGQKRVVARAKVRGNHQQDQSR